MVVAADTAAGLHTLGEEYCDIVQLKTSTNFFPTFMVPSLSRTLLIVTHSLQDRFLLVACHVLVPYLWERFCQKFGNPAFAMRVQGPLSFRLRNV